MNSMIHKSYLMILLICAHFSLFSMKPQGFFRKTERYFEQISARLFRPGQIPVFMNDAKTATLSPDAKKPLYMSTIGLIGCTATVFYAKDHEARQHAILTHYHPNYQKEQLIELERQIQLLMECTKSFKSMKFLSILPEDSYWIDLEAHTADRHKRRKEFEAMVAKACMYPDIDMLHTTYSLPPTNKCECAQAYVTLLNDTPSAATVIHWNGGYQCELE